MNYKPFSPARFENLVKEFQQQEALIMSHKGDEYAANEDRLQNFREVAGFLDQRLAEVALSYLLKHIQSIALAVRTEKYAWAWEKEGGEGLKQRIADARNYLLLLAACLEEEHQAKERVRFDRAFATYYETQG
jgi:hypothetical protein